MRTPLKVTDSKASYVLVTERKDLGNGLSEEARYDSVPPNPDYQFILPLDYQTGAVEVIENMEPMPRVLTE